MINMYKDQKVSKELTEVEGLKEKVKVLERDNTFLSKKYMFAACHIDDCIKCKDKTWTHHWI